jgi:hypothetical protein
MDQLTKLAAKQRLVAVLNNEFYEDSDFDKEAKAKAFFEGVGKALSKWGKKAKDTAVKEYGHITKKPQGDYLAKVEKGQGAKKLKDLSKKQQRKLKGMDEQTKRSRTRAAVVGGGGLAGLGALGLMSSDNK